MAKNMLKNLGRFELLELTETTPYLVAKVQEYPTNDFDRNVRNRKVLRALVASLKETAEKMIQLAGQFPREAMFAINNIESPSFLVHFMASYGGLKIHEKQQILEISDLIERADKVQKYLYKELQIL